MAASVSSVLTLGFGSFSSPELLPTLGFGLGEAIENITLSVTDFTLYVPGDTASKAFIPGHSRKQVYVPGDQDRKVAVR